MDSDRTFFITTVTAHRQPIFRRDAVARLLIETLAHYRDERKYLLHEFVIMPDHVHGLTLAPEISLERAMQFFKGGFSFRLKSRPPVWQASFSNHRIRDFADYENHREYVRMNPVRARLVARAEAYPYSSAAGVLRLDPVPRGLKPCCESQIGSSRVDQELRQPAWATPAMARTTFTAMLSCIPESPSPPQTPGTVPERRAATPRLLTVESRPGSPPAPAASDPHIATPFPADDLDGAPECAGWAAANRLRPRPCPRSPGHEVAASSRYSIRSVATEPAGRRPPIVLPSTVPDPPSLAHPAPDLPPDASHPPRAGCLPLAVPPSTAIPVHPDASASQKSQSAAARGKLRRQSYSPQSPER